MAETKSGRMGTEVKVVPTGACYDCGGRCVHRVHVRDGVAVRVETDDGDEPQLRSCVRGRAYRKHLYSPNRLRFPLKRVGHRGEGEFERISWDEALGTVANELLRVKDTYGAHAIWLHTYSGRKYVWYAYGDDIERLLHSLGGCTTGWGGASAENSVFAARATYGTLTTGHTRDDHINSRLIILWGLNPAESIYSTNTSFYLMQAKEAGVRIVLVDPRYTRTAAVLADQWIPIKPGTDAAMMAAMAYVMITETLHDQRFLDRYTVGFDKFKDYVMGIEDGVPKTPAWAEAKTGVPAGTIISLAREYAIVKPAALIPGYAPGRTAYGWQYHRAASTLAAMTGNIGIHGGGAAGFEQGPVGSMFAPAVTEAADASPKALDVQRRLRTRHHHVKAWDAILKGTAGGYPSDIKMAYVAGANPLNQFPNINKGVEALKKLEFIVVHEQFMTATAMFADIVLPVTTHWERNGFARPWGSGPYFLYLNKVIDPLPEGKSDHDICCELARRLGVSEPSWDVPEEVALRQSVEGMGDIKGEITDFEKFKNEGVHKIKLSGPLVCFEEKIKDPDKYPFPTPSGKIEIYSQRIADLNNPEISSIPKYIDTWEGPGDPLIKKYPLQLITFHHRVRAHSNFDNNPWLRELEPQCLWISTKDAQSRGIGNADSVRVFNDRGETIIRAKVMERIMPGVVALGEGAWYRPDGKGRDRAGSANILTRDVYAPGGGFPFNTSLVQVEKFRKE